jgi:glycerate 2-kinase
VSREFPGVTWDKMLVDAMTVRMTLKPQTLDTIVATNLHVDILSGCNTEFLPAFAIAMAGEPGIFALAADSDGIDGTEDAAGALATPDTRARARVANLDPRSYMAVHDSYSFFAGVGDLVRTGPTGTNVNDIRAVLITRGGQQAD